MVRLFSGFLMFPCALSGEFLLFRVTMQMLVDLNYLKYTLKRKIYGSVVLIYPFYRENIYSSSHLPTVYLKASLFIVAILLSTYHISIYILFDKEGKSNARIKILFHGNFSCYLLQEVAFFICPIYFYPIYALSIPSFTSCSAAQICSCQFDLMRICMQQFIPTFIHPHIIMNQHVLSLFAQFPTQLDCCYHAP